jgi:predicted dehydrogenase
MGTGWPGGRGGHVGDKVRIGVVGTSWWADAMYLPALTSHPRAEVRAVVGMRAGHTREFADRWAVPGAYPTLEAMLDAEPLDGVVILAPNRHHHPMTMAVIERGLHVLCEKPLGVDAAQAREMTEAAERAGVVNMCPFTYRFMPHVQHAKALVDGGYIGRPYHLNMRYYTGYARDGGYIWRLDRGEAGAGVAGDLGSHWSYLAGWLFGEVSAVTAVLAQAQTRGPRPDGAAYEPAEDVAHIVLEFANGATGSIHVSAVAYEPSSFGQLHQWELHGADGTLHVTCDWNRVQRVDGARSGEPVVREIPIPAELLDGLRTDTVHDTYRDVFRGRDVMARGFVTAIATGGPATPSFRDGWAVQRIVDAAGLSAREGRRVTIEEIAAGERRA